MHEKEKKRKFSFQRIVRHVIVNFSKKKEKLHGAVSIWNVRRKWWNELFILLARTPWISAASEMPMSGNFMTWVFYLRYPELINWILKHYRNWRVSEKNRLITCRQQLAILKSNHYIV